MSRSEEWQEGYRQGVKDAVTLLKAERAVLLAESFDTLSEASRKAAAQRELADALEEVASRAGLLMGPTAT